MNEKQIVRDVAIRAGLTQRAAADAVVAVIDAIMSGVMDGHQVDIPLFGTFATDTEDDQAVPVFRPDNQFIWVVRRATVPA